MQTGVRKRAPKACKRCHAQKIRCNGFRPCDQCTRRGHICQFTDLRQRVTITRDYVSDQQTTIETLQQDVERAVTQPQCSTRYNTHDIQDGASELPQTDMQAGLAAIQNTDRVSPQIHTPNQEVPRVSPEAPLTNPLVGNPMSYVFNTRGRSVFMSDSSSWAFGRRVLSMTHEQLTGSSLRPDSLHFPDITYDLGWNGTRVEAPQLNFDKNSLPSRDFALHLIEVVKFRCAKLFFLFDEEAFMAQFTLYHDGGIDSQSDHLWYVHYLLILSFGRAFLFRGNWTQKPPGADLFVQAMKLLPDLTFFDADPVELIQVLCCTALYLQCIDFRVSAYRVISDALRVALLHGMHTSMRNPDVDDSTYQKYLRVWWTVYVLERWVNSLMGLPKGIADEAVHTPLPVYPLNSEDSHTTDILFKLSRVMAQILDTVYGSEGRVDKKFLKSTKGALRSIASVTDQLNRFFPIFRSDATAGISRIAAHLHLLHHQCIIMTTRPLLYSFLQSRLGLSSQASLSWVRSTGIRALLQMCLDSAQKIVKILCALMNQGLLEGFLPFDLDAAFAASIALVIVTTIDETMFPDHLRWSQCTYDIFDEISSHGNIISKKMKHELQQLDSMLHQLSPGQAIHEDASLVNTGRPDHQAQETHHSSTEANMLNPEIVGQRPIVQAFEDNFNWQEELTAAQLMDIADAVDIDSLTWLSTSGLDFSE